MNRKYLIVIFFAVIICTRISYAHQDQYFESEFGNVSVILKTYDECEEVMKSEFISKYCHELAKKLNYKDKISINLIHDYGFSMKEGSFISYNNGYYKTKRGENEYQQTFKAKEEDNRIVIWQIQSSFSINLILKQLEYAILNLDKVKQSSNSITHKGYSENMTYTFESIHPSKIKSIYKSSNSSAIKQVLSKRINRHEEDDYLQLSYFTQNSKFYLYYNYHDGDQVVDSLNNIYSFNRIDSNRSFIFTSTNEFYCVYEEITSFQEPLITKKHTIKTIKGNDYSYDISVDVLSDGIFSIYHYSFGIENHAVFYIEDEYLISDFTSVLKELKTEKR